MSMICVSTILWLIILSAMFHNLFTSVLPLWTSLVAQTVNYLPTMQETQTWSLDWEDPLEKEMATHSSTLAWKIPWTEERGRLQSMGSQSRTWQSYFTFLPLWLTPNYFFSCYCQLNCFIIFLLNCSLLMYRNTTDFYLLTLSPTTLLKLFIVSNSCYFSLLVLFCRIFKVFYI